MAKSRIRISNDHGGWSEHEVPLFITVYKACVPELHILIAQEDIAIPLRDISDLMRELWAEANDELPEI